MIGIKGNPETVFDTLCRHLAPGKPWKIDNEELVTFGSIWGAVTPREDVAEAANTATRENIKWMLLHCDAFSTEETLIIEEGIATLEGLPFVDHTNDDDDDDDGEDEDDEAAE